jgi:hypothetical protein
MAILAIRPLTDARLARVMAVAGLAFLVVRLGGLTVSTTLYDQSWRQATTAIDHLPRHARVLALVGRSCDESWNPHKLEHVPALALVRRHAFVNDQWAFSTAQLLRVTKADAPGFVEDPSQMVLGRDCQNGAWAQIDSVLTQFPRASFDFVWMIAPPKFARAALGDLQLLWTNGRDSLYRIPHPETAEAKP